jgi:hypothetical protein
MIATSIARDRWGNGFECRDDSQLMPRQKVQTTTQASNEAGDPVQMAGTPDHFRGL